MRKHAPRNYRCRVEREMATYCYYCVRCHMIYKRRTSIFDGYTFRCPSCKKELGPMEWEPDGKKISL